MTKDALNQTFPITITLNATKDERKLEGSRTITLQREPSKAASIGSNNDGSGVISCSASSIFTLPGIEKQFVVTPIDAVHVLDQYGQIMTDKGTIPAANFKVYPATKRRSIWQVGKGRECRGGRSEIRKV